MRHKYVIAISAVLAIAVVAVAQTERAYESGGYVPSSPAGGAPSQESAQMYGGLLDPARLSVSHSMSFMAGGSQLSSVKSQSVYSTMMQYKFNAPITLTLNFDMPLHSTFNERHNLNQNNLQSFDYFRNMPIDASLLWHPTQNFMMRVSVITQPTEYGFINHNLGYRHHYRNGNSAYRNRLFR